MLNSIMFSELILVDINKNETYININDYYPVLQGAWNNSNTGKTALLVKNKINEKEYWLTNKQCSNGTVLNDNPYFPDIPMEMRKFLLNEKETGVVKDKNFYWSIKIQNKRIDTSDNNSIMLFLNDYYNIQKKYVINSNNYINVFIELAINKTNNKKVIEKIYKLRDDIFIDIKECCCSFSHGDLWIRDVFFPGIIIDWEWYVNCAPLGTDPIDFLFSYYEHWNNINILKEIMNKKCINVYTPFLYQDNIEIIIKYFIFRYLCRSIIQYGLSIQESEWYKKMYTIALSSNNREY